METNKAFEVFITNYAARVAVIEATNIYAAYDRAFDLFPAVDFSRFLVVPTTIDRILGGVR